MPPQNPSDPNPYGKAPKGETESARQTRKAKFYRRQRELVEDKAATGDVSALHEQEHIYGKLGQKVPSKVMQRDVAGAPRNAGYPVPPILGAVGAAGAAGGVAEEMGALGKGLFGRAKNIFSTLTRSSPAAAKAARSAAPAERAAENIAAKAAKPAKAARSGRQTAVQRAQAKNKAEADAAGVNPVGTKAHVPAQARRGSPERSAQAKALLEARAGKKAATAAPRAGQSKLPSFLQRGLAAAGKKAAPRTAPAAPKPSAAAAPKPAAKPQARPAGNAEEMKARLKASLQAKKDARASKPASKPKAGAKKPTKAERREANKAAHAKKQAERVAAHKAKPKRQSTGFVKAKIKANKNKGFGVENSGGMPK